MLNSVGTEDGMSVLNADGMITMQYFYNRATYTSS